MRGKLRWLLIPAIFGLTFLAQVSQTASAYTPGRDAALDKVVAYNLSSCYNVLQDSVTLLDAKWSDANATYKKSLFSNTSKRVPMPNTVMNGTYSASPTLTCEEFLFGNDKGWEGFINPENYLTDRVSPNIEKIGEFLEKMGYRKEVSGGNGSASSKRCITITYQNPSRQELVTNGVPNVYESNAVCFKTQEISGVTYVTRNYAEYGSTDGIVYGIAITPDGADVSFRKYDAGSADFIWGSISVDCDGQACTWDQLVDKFRLKINSSDNGSAIYTVKEMSAEDGEDVTTNDTVYTRGSLGEMRQSLSGLSGDYDLDRAEVYNFYVKYISNGDYVNVACSDTIDFSTQPGNWMKVNVKRNGAVDNTCWAQEINVQKYTGGKLISNSFDGSQGRVVYKYRFTDQNLSLAEIIRRMNEFNLNEIGNVLDVNPNADPSVINPPDEGQTVEPGEQDVCYAESGSLGWIICPVITAATGVGEHMWNQIENYHLKIPAQEVFKSGGGVETGWKMARDIANVLFVILFLVVIISQLTGYGIDNYGIKKILPRIIVIAILVNLSYIICELAVDLSNIFGVSLNDMLTNLAVKVDPAAGASGASQAGSWIVGSVLLGGGVTLFAFLQTGSLGGALAWIGLAVLGLLLVIVLAMLTLYLILIAREAGIVLCVVIAPVAIVCYALPNTEKYAKKWFELFKALMVVYPICGAMVGGGRLAGSILASIDNSGMKVAAMVVQVLPFFLVPTLLKSSLSLMGNVGAKLSSLGRGLGRRSSAGLKGAIKGTDRFKDWQQYQKDNTQERRARRIQARLKRRSTLSDRQKDRLKKANDVVLAAEGRRRRADLGSSEVAYRAAEIGQQKRAEAEEMQDYMTLINDETRNGEDSNKLLGMFDDYMAKGDKFGAVAVARIAGRRKDTAAEFLSEKITGQSIKFDENNRPIETLNDVTAKYDSAMLSSVMKEVATGENSSAYRESSPFGFEFAAQYNKNYKEKYGEDDERPEVNYADWRANRRNTSDSLNRYVANSQALVGLKGSSLDEINNLMTRPGAVSDEERARIRRLANETIDNRGKTGVWDTTKARQIYALAGRSDEYDAMVNNAAGSVRGENAAAGAEVSSMDVRAASAAQTQSASASSASAQPDARTIAGQTQSSQVAQQTVQRATQAQQVAGGAPAPIIQEAASRTQAPQVQMPQVVRQVEQGPAIDLRAMGDETLLDIATNPNAKMDDTTRVAAENEYLRRTQAPKIQTTPQVQASQQQARPQQTARTMEPLVDYLRRTGRVVQRDNSGNPPKNNLPKGETPKGDS